MPLVVNENTYAALDDADAYFALRAKTADWEAADVSGAAREAALVAAADYLERRYRFKGRKADPSQRLSFPAKDAEDKHGNAFGENGAPLRVKEAQFEVAFLVKTGAFAVNNVSTRDDYLKRDKLDVLEQEWDTQRATPGGNHLLFVDDMLAEYVQGGSLART